MASAEGPAQSISDEQVQQYLAFTLANVRRGVEQLADSNMWNVQAGSPMSTDDARTDPYHLSHAAWSLLGSGIDHLHAISNLIEEAKVLHPMALFTLARGTIETAATAAWMLAPAARPERLARRFRLALKDAADSHSASEEIGAERNRTRGEQRERLLSLAAAAGLDLSTATKRVTSTEMIKAADETSGSKFHVYPAWQICSGFAHGRMWATLSVLERTAVLEDPTTGVGLYQVTSNLAQIAWTVGAGLDVLRHAADLYQRGATNHVEALFRP